MWKLSSIVQEAMMVIFEYCREIGRMKKMPRKMPEYTIYKSNKEPFEVNCEELEGWFVLPKEYEEITWARYTCPDRMRRHYTQMYVGARASMHEVTGRNIHYKTGMPDGTIMEGNVIAQFSGSYQRILAESYKASDDDARRIVTFLDKGGSKEAWKQNDKIGGIDRRKVAKGSFERVGNQITIKDMSVSEDVVGRYKVCIGEREFTTMCVMEREGCEEGTVWITEKYVDRRGRTVISREFMDCGGDWEEYKAQLEKAFEGKVPKSEYLLINGQYFVHVADNISQYVL